MLETDYLNRSTKDGFSIEAVVEIPAEVGIADCQQALWPWEWDGQKAVLPDPSHQGHPVQPVFKFRIRGTDELEPVWEVIQPNEDVVALSVGLRRKIGVVRLANDDRNDRDLRLVSGSGTLMHIDDPTGSAVYRLASRRRKELCGLAVFQVPETAHLDDEDHPLIGVPLTITKGDKPRTIYPPIRLVDRTQRYIDEVRTPQVRALRRQRPDYRPPSALFLNLQGNAVSKARLTAVFAAAFRAAGVTGTLHYLRHTFAMTMLVRLQRQASSTPDLNPLKIVQVLLGHSSIQSTAIYLRCVELNGRDLADSIDYLYCELIPDGR